jgi:hypothetical protein
MWNKGNAWILYKDQQWRRRKRLANAGIRRAVGLSKSSSPALELDALRNVSCAAGEKRGWISFSVLSVLKSGEEM